MSFYVYMLRCADGSYYVGHTEDLEARMAGHRQGSVPGCTSSRRPLELVWCDLFESRQAAFERERQVKGWSRRKNEALVRGDWEAMSRLAHAHGSTGSR